MVSTTVVSRTQRFSLLAVVVVATTWPGGTWAGESEQQKLIRELLKQGNVKVIGAPEGVDLEEVLRQAGMESNEVSETDTAELEATQRWLRDHGIEKSFEYIEKGYYLNLERKGIKDDELRHLAVMKGLTTLELNANPIRGPGLEYLQRLPLETLKLSDTMVDDSVMPQVKSIPTLKRLFLSDTKITDRGIEVLAGHPGLETLDVSRTLVTDGALPHVARLSRLNSLICISTGITDAGLLRHRLIHAASGRQRSLKLKGKQIDDDDLQGLANLTQLTKLDLRDNPITDEGLTVLAGLPGLTEVNLEDTEISPEGLQLLIDANPSLRVKENIGGFFSSPAVWASIIGLAVGPVWLFWHPGAVLIWLALTAIVGGGLRYAEHRPVFDTEAEARVVDTEWHITQTATRSRQVVFRPVVQFTDARGRTVKLPSKESLDVAKGETLAIYYNPARPSRLVIKHPWTLGQRFADVITLAVVAFVTGLLGIYLTAMQRRHGN